MTGVDRELFQKLSRVFMFEEFLVAPALIGRKIR
jgi:hypothetical protein